jgi:hypothetical protein
MKILLYLPFGLATAIFYGLDFNYLTGDVNSLQDPPV